MNAPPLPGLDELARARGLSVDQAAALARMLAALAAEPDPPTRIDPGDAVDGHLADSLAGLAVPELAGTARVADLGAGAGFPGLALAVALPGSHVDLVEASARKCAVIERLIAAARLTNARALARRAEELTRTEGRCAYTAVTARALAPLPVLVEYAAPLLGEAGVLVAWKGRRQAGEERAGGRAAAQVGLALSRVIAVTPFAGAHSRHLHVFTKTAPTPERFPRRPGIAVKRPLGQEERAASDG